VCREKTKTEFFDEPGFVSVVGEGDVRVEPVRLNDIGHYLMGIQQTRNRASFFTTLQIIVLTPLTTSKDQISPYFCYPLTPNQTKLLGNPWKVTFPNICGTHGNYAKIEITRPWELPAYVKLDKTTMKYPNDSFILSIEEENEYEKVSNITIDITLSKYYADYGEFLSSMARRR